MAIIKCKMCGGSLILIEGSSVCECDSCGTRQTVPKADDEKKLTLFGRAGRLLRACEFDKAAGVFETIAADFPEEAEAYWGLVLCKYGIEYVDDPATGKKIPTCHRSSFDSVTKDSNYEQACENADPIARRVYREEARQIEELRQAILQVSGREEPYDVFISYKETDVSGERTLDSEIAQNIYRELTREGYRVFFSRISLEDKLGTEYEPYIFAALNSARVMIVVGTDYENFEAVWVKNEWSRYLKLIAKGEKKTLIPVYKNMDPYDMPEEFRKLAAQDMGKYGAVEDLVHAVEKLVGKKTAEAAPAQPTAQIVQQTVVQGGGPNVIALLKRGQQALEDGEWDKARGFYDQVLSMDAENADAFLGLALAGQHSRDLKALKGSLCSGRAEVEKDTLERDKAHIGKSAERTVVPGYFDGKELTGLYDFEVSYPVRLRGEAAAAQQIRSRFSGDRNLSRAFRYARGETQQKLEELKTDLFDSLDRRIREAEAADKKALEEAEADYAAQLEEADRKAEELSRAAQEKREADYQEACRLQEEARTEEDYWKARDAFLSVRQYKDAAERAKGCEEKAEEVKTRREQAEREAKEKAEAAQRKKNRRVGIILGAVAVAVIAALILVTQVIIPARKAKALDSAALAEYNALFSAFKANDGWEEVNAITSFLDDNDRAEAVLSVILADAEAGDPYAQYLASYCYSNGVCTEEDDDLAFAWAQKSADQGNSYGINILGVRYLYGTGVAADTEKGLELYLQAAELGNPVAMNNLGNCYRTGEFVEQDYDRAREWYLKGADAGNGTSMLYLGHMYYTGDGGIQDYTQSAYWYEKAAKLGKDNAMENLGVQYYNGNGVARDYAKAKYWWEKAAELGNPRAMENLGTLYEYGLGVEKNMDKANEWYEKAKAAG